MRIIITGASKGIGKAIAKQFLSDKNVLILCARNKSQLEETVQEFKTIIPECALHIFSADVSNKSEIDEFASFSLQFGTPSVVINNAGQFVPGSIYNEPEGILEKMLSINLFSAYHLTRRLLPKMMEDKQGHIFNICSIASLQAYANGGSYSISKFALQGFSKNLREELKPYHIKVTSVLPGAAFTDSWSGTGINPERIMEADDIANMVFSAAQLSPQACVEDIILRPILGDL